jgi:hypothetical protein
VTDYSRVVEHGRGVPGIFFKFDLEGLSMTVEERTTTLYQFLIRLAGVIGEWNPHIGFVRLWADDERAIQQAEYGRRQRSPYEF